MSGNLDLKDVKETGLALKEKNFTNEQIIARPKALLLNKMTVVNRIKVLNECSFKDINLVFLYKFVAVVNKNISLLKAYGYIDREKDIAKSLASRLDIPVTFTAEINDDMSLNMLREIIINSYLKDKLEMSSKDITKYWSLYSRIRHKSLESIVENIRICEEELHFSRERIVKNGFILYACPENLRELIDSIPHIANVPIQEILYRRPKIAMSSAEGIRTIIDHIKSFDIPEESILKCLDLLTLGSDTVLERLRMLTQTKEFSVLCSNPRVLMLIHFINKAKTRLDYLKQLKVKCASLNILASSSDTFEKYAREGVDRTKGRDGIYYVAKVMNMSKDDVRNIFNRHPNWCHVPIMSIKNSLDYLRYKGFSDKEITENLHLLLYPSTRIAEKLNALLEWKDENNENRLISGVALSAISNSKLLNLCLYFIEAEFHFSGDGIWEPNRIDHRSDLFTTTIPEFPKSLTKHYKYGTQDKSATDSRAEVDH